MEELKLDASESTWFLRELESIDSTVYAVKYPDLEARDHVPLIGGIPEHAKAYRYGTVEGFGKAKFITDMADDLPQTNVTAEDNNLRLIKALGNSWGYDIFELKAMAVGKVKLNAEKAKAARRAAEELIDDTLATGATAQGLEGLLNLTGAQTYTLASKAKGGTSWGTLGAPNATAQEIYNDLVGIASAQVSNTDGVFTSFDILLPIDQFNLAEALPFGTGLQSTPLKKALENRHINSIKPWHKCKTAGTGGVTRMACYKKDAEVLGGIVPMEFNMFAPQQRNLKFIVNTMASCGGVVLRYPKGVAYADSL